MAFLGSHTYRREITLDSTLIDSTLTDFPVMVRLTDTVNIDMSKTKTDGSDVLFTSSDGTTILDFEREKHDTTGGEGIYWVRIPSVSSSIDTIIYVYYDNGTALADQEDPENTWSSDYKAVYHLHDDFLDSTSNNNDLTDNSTGDVTGKLAEARDFGNNKWLDASDSASLDITSAIHLKGWVKSSDYNQATKRLVEKAGGSDSIYLLGIHNNSVYFGLWTGGSQTFFLDAGTLTNNQDHHIICEYDGSNMICYLDGVQVKSISKTGSIDTSGNNLNIGRRENPSPVYWGANDYIDEIRISDTAKGADWAKAEFNSEDDNLLTFGSEETGNNAIVSENAQATETISVKPTAYKLTISENAEATENISTIFPQPAPFATKIISYNPLIFVTDGSPAKIVEVDVTNPLIPIYSTTELVGVTNATDVARNSETGFLYISCADGKVVKIDETDLGSQTIIDLSDTDNLLTIETLSSFNITYTSTENTVGELYLIDERETALGDFRLDVLVELSTTLDSSFNSIEGLTIDTNFNALSYVTGTMNCDFKCLTDVVNNIDPIKRTDFDIEIDGSPLNQSDFDLQSITITHTVDEESVATFNLCRRHDDIDKDLDGNTSVITNQNAVTIKIDGETEFNGFVSELNCVYSLDQEQISVTATALEKTCKFNDITLSLPSLDKPLGLYDVLAENPVIFNPVLDEDDDNPVRFKGIRAPLGTRVTQSFSRFTTIDTFKSTAESINDNTFVPKQNWTYFWTPTVIKFGAEFTLGEVRTVKFNYIGTSLSPVSEDLWVLDQADNRRQRQYDDLTWKLGDGTVQESDFDDIVDNTASLIAELKTKGWIDSGNNITSSFKTTTDSEELELTVSQEKQIQIYEVLELALGYTVGSAPFKDINTRNGIFIPKWHWVDESNGLYSIKDPSFNFEDYVKEVADLEHQKIQNINGDVLPETRCNMDISIDCYKYYDFNILSRIRVDNTTEDNIFTNNNGFPTAIKSIIISSNSMRTTIITDNLKSNKELEAIDGEFPDENSEEFNEKEKRILIDLKSDMRTGLPIE